MEDGVSACVEADESSHMPPIAVPTTPETTHDAINRKLINDSRWPSITQQSNDKGWKQHPHSVPGVRTHFEQNRDVSCRRHEDHDAYKLRSVEPDR